MRQSITTTLFAVLLSMVGINAFAHDIEVKNADVVTIYYKWINNNTELEVSCRGRWEDDYDNEYTGNVLIPNSVEYNGNTYLVTSIGLQAFYGCSGLTSVTIPNSVTSVDARAFSGCSGLSSIKVESGKGKYDSRNNCNAIIETSSNTLILGCKNTIIPNSVTSIGSYAFSGCSGLTSVTIPNSVTFISSYAFSGCSGLTSVTIPNSVTSIGSSAFSGCRGLASVTIGNGVTSISHGTFSGCSALTSVFIGNSVTFIDERAFWHCTALTSVHISDLKVWCGISFYDYWDNPLCIAGHLYLNGEEVKDLVIPNSVTSIGGGVFYGCRGLTSVTIPNSVTSIGSSAFSGCSGLTSINIPNSVTSIGGNAFSGTAWYNNQPDGLIYAGKVAYKYKGKMPDNTSITIKDGTLGIAGSAFEDCSGLTSVTIPNSVTSIGGVAFYGCSGLTSVTIPNSVTSIGNSAFYGCSGLTSVTIPNSVTSIGSSAFYGCSGLTSVTIPNSVKSIGWEAFRNCSGLTSIAISSSVTSIGGYAFSACSGLTSITIPNSVTSIGYGAIDGCSGLTSVVSEIEDPFAIDNGVFNGVPSNATLIVPKGKKSIYQSTAGWNQFANIAESSGKCGDNVYYSYDGVTHTLTISGEGVMWGWQLMEIDDRPWRSFYKNIRSIVINSGVTSIGNWAFTNFESLTSVTIPSSVATIYDCAFLGCSGLTSVTIPNGVIMIEDDDWGGAFGNCTGLTSLIIPKSVTSFGSLGGNTFRGCSGLTSIQVESDNQKYDSRDNCNAIIEKSSNTLISGCKNTIIPNSVISIGYKAFRDCRGLTSVTIPNSVTSIGSSAFSGCSGLTSVNIPNSVTSIGGYAFYACSGLTSVIVGNGMTNIGSDSYGWSSTNLKEMILSQTAYENGIPASVTKFTTYSNNPMRVVVTSKGATSAMMDIYPIDDNGNTNEDNYYTVTMLGLTPGQYIKWKLDEENYGIVSEKTSALTLTTQPAKPTSTTKARLTAMVNEADDDLHFGFEWLRNDAPGNMPANKVSAPLYEGKIIGSLSGLNPDIYYKYRPYYQSDNGETYYGEWLAFLTGDANVFFEPETHTKDVAEVTSVSAQLAGVWIEGTEDIEEKGFEYWSISSANTRATGEDIIKVIVDGNKTTATIDGLMAGKVYGYHSYVKTASGTKYGEDKTFRTVIGGDVNGDGVVNEADVKAVADFIMGDAPTGFNKDAADVNNDDTVNAADIVLINNIIKKE